MFYYVVPQKRWSWLIFPNQNEALGGAIMPIAISVRRSEAPKAWGESHRSLPQGNPATVSDNLDNPDFFKIFEVIRSRSIKMCLCLKTTVFHFISCYSTNNNEK